MREDARIPVAKSEFFEFFEESLAAAEHAEDGVFVLRSDAAADVWVRRFGEGSTTYFNLPDSSWVVRADRQSVGHWLESFNDGETETVHGILSGAIGWSPQERVLFCARRNSVLSITWRLFLSLWDCFLAFEDDCPIVVPERSGIPGAIIFTPLGEIRAYGSIQTYPRV